MVSNIKKEKNQPEPISPINLTLLQLKQAIAESVSDKKKIERDLDKLNNHMIRTALPHYKK